MSTKVMNEPYETMIREAAEQVAGGAFLMTGKEEKNPMTIGWCQWGNVWGMPICTVFVRQTRYTHGLIERDGAFTVSVPEKGAMKKELSFCGSRSGRDTDKKAQMSLTTLPAQTNGIDALAGCALHFECEVVFKLEMGSNMDALAPDIRSRFYNPASQEGTDGNPHTLYFGKIVSAYRT